MANNVQTMIIWEAGCVELLATLKSKPILLCCQTEHTTKRVPIVPTVYDGPPTSESVIFVCEDSADSIVVRVGSTWENGLNIDEHYCKVASVVCREPGTVGQLICWFDYVNRWVTQRESCQEHLIGKV